MSNEMISTFKNGDARIDFKTEYFTAFVGTPRYVQTHGVPVSLDVNVQSFNLGILTFCYERDAGRIYWLSQMDFSGDNQVWTLFSDTNSLTDNLAYIAVLPILADKLYWFVDPVNDPTQNEPIPAGLFDGTYGMLWWNRSTNALFKLTAYSDNGDGTYEQTWDLIASDPVKTA